MKERTKYHTGPAGREDFPSRQAGISADGLLLSHSDQVLLEEAASYIMAESDIEEIMNDPGFDSAMLAAGEMISDYRNKPSWSRENAKFVIESLEKAQNEIMLEKEINEIEREAHNKGVFRATAEWVAERDRQAKGMGNPYPGDRERREFISSALKDEVTEQEKDSLKVKKRIVPLKKYLPVPAAAAVIALIALRFLSSPEGTPAEIYNKFYEPATMVSPVTRGAVNGFTENYAAGIEKYRSGDYTGAAHHFALAMQADGAADAPKFYFGVTNLAMGNYRAAADHLSEIAGTKSAYGQEAQWYLGLSYLMINEKEKAEECFKGLASAPGYYRDRALKVLRRIR